MDLKLAGRKALITGGSRGIGKAVTRALLAEGVDCVICGRSRESLEVAAKTLAEEAGRSVHAHVADVRDRRSLEALVEFAAERMGGIDILVNNAARVSGGEPEDFARVDEAMVLRDFEEKFLGYLRCSRLVAPYMQAKGWGRIINVSGYAARMAGNLSAGARNASVVHLTKSLSIELGKHGINVNAIYPGMTVTETLTARAAHMASQANRTPAEQLQLLAAQQAIGRLVDASEIAHVVAFLASPLAAGITGEAIAVTGGVGHHVTY
jgi:NAD(P)-dependent dehydrogenase (short-subunit alcohol dehydrogenase family)